MKKILSLVLSIFMILGMAPTVFADETKYETITVYLSVSDNGEFVTSPVTDGKMAGVPVEISYFDLADYGLEKYYRYEADSFENGGAYINETVVEQPTLMHLFIKAVEDYYLGDKFDVEEYSEILSFTGDAMGAYASRFWNHDSNFTYLVNNKMPEMSAGWGASCDYILLEDGMEIEIGMFSSWDWAYSGTVASFGDKEVMAYAGGSINFRVKGDPLFYGGSEQVELDSDKIFLVKSTQLDWVNDETAEYITEADENGFFNVRFDVIGEYYVSAIDVNVGSETASIAPAVCKVTVTESSSLPDFDGYWTSFRGNENNMGIVDAKIPKSEGSAKLKWAQQYSESWMDNTTPPVIVEGDLYFAKNNKVLKVSAEDGSIIEESEELVGNIGFGTTSITYGGGMFYVPIGSGRIQALRADTLESVWVSETLGGQTITPVAYMDGKVYCGTWNGETESGTYFCLSTEDNDTNQRSETKECLWKIEHPGGFYWAGAYVTEEYVLFGSDDGESEGTNGESVLYSVNPENGEIIDKLEGLYGDVRSSVSFDPETDSIYFTTKGGLFCKAKVNEDGTFDDDAFELYELGGASTVTPLVYNGLAYIGVTNSAQFEKGGYGYKIIDVNAAPMKEVAAAEVPGSVQSCALMTTAYEDTGWVYVYITYNNIPGGIFELAVKKSAETDEDGAAVVTLSAKEIFVPEDEMAQYCICSPICDENGTIYYKNDSGYLMAVRRRASSIATGGSSSGGGTAEEDNKTEEVKDVESEAADKSESENTSEISPEPEKNVETKNKFEDIKGHWAEEYINDLCTKGIINGKSEREFAPDDNVTRGEFVSLLFRLSGDEGVRGDLFDDVASDDWYSEAVCWAAEKGITTGVSDRMFAPYEKITREMAVVFIARYAKCKGIVLTEVEKITFKDEKEISDWAKVAIGELSGLGLITGKGDGLFKPLDNATRAETAKILINLIGVIERNEK